MIFSNFSNFQKFLILIQKSTINVEKTFFWINSIWLAFYKRFAPFRDFEKKSRFFSETPIRIFKKPKFRSFRAILLFQSHSTANVREFGEKNLRSETWKNIVNAIGKDRLEKNPFERNIILSYFVKLAENSKMNFNLDHTVETTFQCINGWKVK